MRRHVSRAFLLTSALFLPATVIAEEARVHAGQSLSDLLGSKESAAATVVRAAPGSGEIASRLALWAGGLAGAVILAAVYRRRRSGSGAVPHGDAIEVVSRAHLSHRHSVFVLRIANRQLVVGVSGDRMTALGALDEVALPPAAEIVSRAPAIAGTDGAPCPPRGFTVRPGDREAISSVRRIPDSELLPYRKQMDRLRGLLRGLRGEFEEGDEPPEGPRS